MNLKNLRRRTIAFGALLAIALLIWVVQSETGVTMCSPIMSNNQASLDAQSWALRTPMSRSRSEIAAAGLDGKVYVTGGISFFHITARTEIYDVASDEWTTGAPLPRRLHHVAMATCEGRVFASGGYTRLNFTHDQQPMLWEYDVQENRWLEEAALPHPLGEHAMTCVNDRLYLVGGREVTGITSAIWQYDLAEQAWSKTTDMPTPRHSAAVAVLDEWIYVMGGRNGTQGAQLDAVEAYHLVEERWETRSPLPIGRGGHAAATLNGRIHVFGGERFDSGEVLAAHHTYDAIDDDWQDALPLATPRHGLAAEVVDDQIYAIGGGCRYGLHTIYSTTGTVQAYRP